MRIVKLISLLVASLVALTCAMNAPCYAASPPAMCKSDHIDILHGGPRFLIDPHEVLVHSSVERITLSKVLLGQKVRVMLPHVSTLIVFDRFDPHAEETYINLATTTSFAHLQRYAAEQHKSLIYIGLAAPPHEPNLVTDLHTLVRSPHATSRDFLQRLCEVLPSGYQMFADNEGSKEGFSLRINVYDARQEQVGVIAGWLDASQTRRAREESWLQWGGVLMLLACALVFIVILARRRRRRLLPAWRDVSSDEKRCLCCGRASASACVACEASGLSCEEALTQAHELALGARQALLEMLQELDVLVQRSRRPLVKLLGTSSQRVAYSQLHAAQTTRLDALREQRATQWFGEEPTALSNILAGRAHQQPPYLDQLRDLLARPLPEFSRAQAPALWRSHLEKLYTLLDVLVLELELRRRVWPPHPSKPPEA